jgi:indole-3-glycerol phosphate synthase
MTVLDKIVQHKADRLSGARLKTSLSDLKSICRDLERPRDFRKAIRREESTEPKLIAEIKKASPSKGLIRKDFDHIAIASIYERRKVDAISVITEEDFFQGSLNFLDEVRKTVTRPVLRKDFIFDGYQIYEARAHGADALLLIAAILQKNQAEDFMGLAEELGMSVLFEVHDAAELETALLVKAPVVGINNRNLKTLKIDLSTSLLLSKEIPEDRIVVSESGIGTRADISRIAASDIDAVLVGTCLMESSDIGLKIDELRGITEKG